MGSELITAETGARLTISYPDSIPGAVAQLAVPVAARVLTELIKAGYNINNDIQRHTMQMRVEKAFRDEIEQAMKDVNPVVATAMAHQFGRDTLRRAGLDDDLEQRARKELDSRLSRRFRE